MAVCIGCGLSVDGQGNLQVALCPTGGIECATNAAPSPAGCTDGLYINPCEVICPNAGLGCATTAAPSPAGCTNGLYVNVGCGLQIEADGQVGVKINETSDDNCLAEDNLLSCDDTNGLSADHLYSIAGNSLICGKGSTFTQPFPQTVAAGDPIETWTTPEVQLAISCNDATQCVHGMTLYDVGGLVVRMQPNSLARVTFTNGQRYVPPGGGGAINFAGLNPTYRMTFDNRGIGAVREQDLVLHDTTWQILCGAQTIGLSLRLELEVIQGSVEVVQATQQNWEITWHYGHAKPGSSGSVQSGCV